MSATADIVVARVTGLVVPSQALRGSTVTVERDGARSTQRVQTGVVGDSSTQVVSGLTAGDKVDRHLDERGSGRTAAGRSTSSRPDRLGAAAASAAAGGGGAGAAAAAVAASGRRRGLAPAPGRRRERARSSSCATSRAPTA